MISNKNAFKGGLFFVSLFLVGCSNQPTIPKVEEAEVEKYEKAYMAEYEAIKQQNSNYQPSFKWVQPKNKKEECKVYVGINPNDDKTIKSDYSLFWDGDCKDGYAYGLGREIETTMLTNVDQIGYYEGGKAMDYCAVHDSSNNLYIESECNYDYNKGDHYVKTIIEDKNLDLNIYYEFGLMGTPNNPRMLMRSWAFSDVVEYYKSYPNYSYKIDDLTKNEFDYRNYEFSIIDHKNKKSNGFGFTTLKNGYTNGGEMINGNFARMVQLPQSYFNKANSIVSEIYREANLALEAQKKALIIKEKYKKKICKDSVKVDFMDNDEYISICKEDEKFAQLKTKIDAKLAKIEEEKQQKRVSQNQQRLISAREAEAMAAQRQAAAAEQANNQQAWDSVNQSLQNMNSNMQMQQLNNNLMMYNYKPKRYDVYLH